MDTKNLKYKHSKTNITCTTDQHSNVIVVPPDILKKLGINIGNSNLGQEITNYVHLDPVPCSDIINNALQGNTSSYVKHSSNSSIVETANLMKKSVFLSPTFVTNATNVISGEVEISDNKHFFDNIEKEIETRTSLDKTDVIKESESTGKTDLCQTYNMLNGTDDMVAKITKNDMENIGNFIKQTQPNKMQDQCENNLPLSLKKDHVSLKDKQYTVNLKKVKEATSSSKYAATENNLVIMSLKDNINFITEADTENLVSLDGNVQLELCDTVNSFDCLEQTENTVEQSEMFSNFISLEGYTVQTQQTEKDISLENNTNLGVDANPITYERSFIQLNENKIVSSFLSSDDLNQGTLSEVENNISSVEGNIHFIKQTGTEIFPDIIENSNQVENITTIKENYINENSNNVLPIQGTIGLLQQHMSLSNNIANQVEQAHNTTTEYESDINHSACKNIISKNSNLERKLQNDSETNNIKSMAKDIKLDSDNQMSGELESVPNGELHYKKISEEQKNIYMGVVKIDGNQSQCLNNKSVDEFSTVINIDTHVLPPIKIGSKINIISEEIIPCSDSQERRRQSLLLKKLTPVALTTVIDTMKINKKCVTDTVNQNTEGAHDFQLLSSITGGDNTYRDTKFYSKQMTSVVHDSNVSKPVVSKKSPIINNVSDLTGTVKEDLKNQVIHKNGDNTDNNRHNYGIDIINSHHSNFIEKVKINEKPEENNELYHSNRVSKDVGTNQHSRRQEHGNSCNKYIKDTDCISLSNHDNNNDSKLDKHINNDSKYSLEKKKYKAKLKGDNNIIDNIRDSADTESCGNELNKILKSTKESSNKNIHIDKVKEIAEYIKKFAHIYKGRKKVLNRSIFKDTHTYNKKESINSETNMIKSKLCIQGVEKPGGNKHEINIKEQFEKRKALKTYVKQKKAEVSCQPQSTSFANEYAMCNAEYASDIDLNTIDHSLSDQTQNFCLCYDFGHLDNFDNSYEHIHFWSHHCDADLADIISIYNDDDTVYDDRTDLDNLSIPQKAIDVTSAGKICWHYFTENKNIHDEIASHKMQVSNDSESVKINETGNDFQQERHIMDKPSNDDANKSANQLKFVHTSKDIPNQRDAIVYKKSIMSMEDNETNLQINMNYGSGMNTIIKKQDDQLGNTSNVITKDSYFKINGPKDLERNDESNDIISQVSCENNCLPESLPTIKKMQLTKDAVETVVQGENIQNANNNQEKYESNAMDTEVIVANPEKIDRECLKHSFSGRNSPKPTSSSCAEKCLKKNIKCGVCNNIFSETKWENHVAKKHSHIAWRADSTFNFDNPDLLEKLNQRLKFVGKLKCWNCNLQTKKVNKFLIHVKKCLGYQDAVETVVQGENIQNTNNNQEKCESNAMDAKSEKIDRKSRKRSFSGRNSPKPTSSSCAEKCLKKNIKCGVCNNIFSETKWENHVAKKHSHIAWRAGSTFNFDNPDLLEKLDQRLNIVGKLKCWNCNMQTKKVNKFLIHVKKCLGCQDTKSRRALSKEDTVVCGVCHQTVRYSLWIEHIGKEHNYLAWVDGQTCLNVDDEASVAKHLQNIVRTNGGLHCYKCGLTRKRAKIFLEHINTCDGTKLNYNYSISSVLDSTFDEESNLSTDDKSTTCGVCKQKVPILKFMDHIAKEHNYLAWPEGSPPLDIDNKEAVSKHLQELIRQSADGLMCYKCGFTRKRVKLYLTHIENCDGEGVYLDEADVNADETVSDEKEFECAVCNATVPIPEWDEHIGREHQYMAWRVGSTPLDVNDKDAVQKHLLDIIRRGDALICYKCGLNRRRVKLYLSHIETCDGSENHREELTDSANLKLEVIGKIELNATTTDLTNKIYKCAICEQDVPAIMWIDHIGKEHQYLAWHQDEEPLDITDEDAVKSHLLIITREHGGLVCNKCHITKKYPKAFQQHIKNCTVVTPLHDMRLKNELYINHFDVSHVKANTVTCGVCNKEVNKSQWMTHIETKHNYIAWFVGVPPLDVNDPVMVHEHLTDVSKAIGGLKCIKCGLTRKYAKTYLQHVDSCTDDTPMRKFNSNEPLECAVCSEKMDPKEWHKHAMEKHYNVAWIVGDNPIDINLPYVVEPYIKEYRRMHDNKLICKTCGISRVSAVGFYAHIIICGKTEEETDIYKNMCEICNNKYLRIYKSQHMTMHKEQVEASQRRILIAKEKELKRKQDEMPVEIVGGRRKAAERAITVIEKYAGSSKNGAHCSKCGFNSEVESEMLSHECVDQKFEDSDSDASIDLDINTDDEYDSDIDSNISEEERDARDQELIKSKKHPDSGNRIQRLPFQIKNLVSYMRKSAEEFAKLHLTDEDLFTEWRRCEYEIISASDLMKFMPPLEESCKVKYNKENDWNVYKRFEARSQTNLITMFTGACIQCICWVPPFVDDNSDPTQEFLSVVTHLAEDIPRQLWHDSPSTKPALIQIWNCRNFITDVPEFVMGIALEYGTIWALDWCPSGARDTLGIKVETPNETKRLGLFAVACANGYAYIFAAPYPSTIQAKGKIFCTLKPLVKLKLLMRSNRRQYQATAIKWSKQKGHAHIVVGYADGTIAYYDLRNDSPLLKSTEDGVTVMYPYFDERAQGMCIEDVDIFATRENSRAPGPVVGGSVSGASFCAGVGATRSSCVQAHSAVSRVLFPPHWPAPVLAGDDNLVSQAINELEWYGGGRRLGGMRACCGCAWCGRLAHTSAPLVRLSRIHPAYREVYRQIIAVVEMVPFGSKRKRKNDELSMTMEPLTYSEAVAKYGIEFKQITARDKNTQQNLSGAPREPYPERFPLADVTSMLFCPSYKHHQKLALAVHAGFIFIMNV